MSLSDNYQFSYQKLLAFLSRKDEKGYVFARADDLRLVPQINNNLKSDLVNKGLDTTILFLRNETDEPLFHQIQSVVKNTDSLIVANLYDIVTNSETGLLNLSHFNFSREALWEINKPIVFWCDARSLNLISNHAPDLFSQRRHITVHFTGTISYPVTEVLQKEGWEKFIDSESFKAIQANIDILTQRLHDSKEAGYPLPRIAVEIALPLAKEYARLGVTGKAIEIIDEFAAELDVTDQSVLEELAEAYYLLHDYENAITSLQKANLIIKQNDNNAFPLTWFNHLIRIADWLLEAGKPQIALEELKKAETIAQKQLNINNTWEQSTLALLYERIGNVYIVNGNLPDAQSYFEQTLQIRNKLSQDNPYSEELQRDLSISYEKLGNTLGDQGYLSNAKKYYEQALQIRQKLSQNNPQSIDLRRGLIISYNKLGLILEVHGNFSEAQNYYEQGLQMAKQLSQDNPHIELIQRDLSISYEKLGNILDKQDNFQDAKSYFEQGLRITEQLSRANPHSEDIQRDLCVFYNKLGDILNKQNDLQNAKNYFERGLLIAEQLSKANPYSEQLKRDLGICYNNLGHITQQLCNLLYAKSYFEQGFIIAEQLSKANPHSEQLQRDIAVSYNYLASILIHEGQHKEALQYYQQALSIIQKLADSNPFSAQLKSDIVWFEAQIKKLQTPSPESTD